MSALRDTEFKGKVRVLGARVMQVDYFQLNLLGGAIWILVFLDVVPS